MKQRQVQGVLAGLLAASAFLAGCRTVPYTGRSQLLLVSESEETQLGLSAYRQILSQSQLSRDPQWTAMVEEVGRRIAQAAEEDAKARGGHLGYAWEFNVIEDEVINAFALPGGKIAFYTGILPICKNPAGVAAVMGHEVAHAIARHGGERISQTQLAALGGALIQEFTKGSDPAVRETVMGVYGVGAGVGFLLPFSRKHESEADHIGLILMAKAGYDPEEAVRFWQRMEQKASGGKPPEFLSTHPSHETRIRQLQEWLPEAKAVYSPR